MTVPAAIVAFLITVVGAAPQSKNFTGAPETFSARAQVATDTARGDVYVTIHVQKYSTEQEIDAVVKALDAGHAAFLERAAQGAGCRTDRDRQTDVRHPLGA